MKDIILIISIFISVSVLGQGFDNDSLSFSIDIEKVANGEVENIIDTLYHEHCVISMSDASQIDKVLFVLKDKLQNVNLYGVEINMDGSTELPEGMSFQVSENQASVIVGPYIPTRVLKYVVLLQDTDGNISEPQIFE